LPQDTDKVWAQVECLNIREKTLVILMSRVALVSDVVAVHELAITKSAPGNNEVSAHFILPTRQANFVETAVGSSYRRVYARRLL
jgi:hypothetical protein